MYESSTRTRTFRALVAAGALVTASFAVSPAAVAAPKGGDDKSYNDVTVDINGGNAKALALCVNYAQVTAKKDKDPQSNACKNFAKAVGGDVLLKNSSISVLQAGTGSGTTFNRVDISISGGDAAALAACVNFLQGTSTPDQENKCENTAVAVGGDVVLKNTDIVIVQG